MKCIGIDIGSFSVKVAEVESNSKGYSLNSLLEYPLSQGPNADHQLEITEILRQLASVYDPTQVRTVLAVSQSGVSTRVKHFPFKDRLKILKSLAYELEDELPFNPDEAVFDARVIAHTASGMDILAVAAPFEVIESVLTRARDGGIDPDMITVDGIALANLFENWQASPAVLSESVVYESSDEVIDGPTNGGSTGTSSSSDASASQDFKMPATAHSARAILHIGHRKSLLLVMRGEQLIAARSVLWGGADLAADIATAFSVPYVEGIKLMQTRGTVLLASAGAGDDARKMSDTLAAGLDLLGRDLRLSLMNIRTEFNLNILQLDLLGGVSQIQNLGAYLTQVIEIPANTISHLGLHKQIKFTPTPQMEASSAVAIGLALEGMRKPKNPSVNLRKQEFIKRNDSLAFFWEKWNHTLAIAAGIIVILYVGTYLRSDLTLRLRDLSAQALEEHAKSVASIKNVAQLPSYIKDQKERIKASESLAKLEGFNSALDILRSISEQIPALDATGKRLPIEIHRYHLESDRLEIEGFALSNEQVAVLENAVKKVARANSVKRSPSRIIAPAGKVGFLIDAKIVRVN